MQTLVLNAAARPNSWLRLLVDAPEVVVVLVGVVVVLLLLLLLPLLLLAKQNGLKRGNGVTLRLTCPRVLLLCWAVLLLLTAERSMLMLPRRLRKLLTFHQKCLISNARRPYACLVAVNLV